MTTHRMNTVALLIALIAGAVMLATSALGTTIVRILTRLVDTLHQIQ